MADLEQEIETQEEQEIETLETETDDSQLETDEEITYEQALQWKKDAEKLKKAEARIEKLKKLEKTLKKETVQTGNQDVRAILEEEKFYDKNPDAQSYRKEIEDLKSKGISREDAYYLASKEDREVEKNREVYGKPLIGDTTSEGISPISIAQFDKMTSAQQVEYTTKMTAKYGKVKYKY